MLVYAPFCTFLIKNVPYQTQTVYRCITCDTHRLGRQAVFLMPTLIKLHPIRFNALYVLCHLKVLLVKVIIV